MRRSLWSVTIVIVMTFLWAPAASAEFAASLTRAGGPVYDGLKGNLHTRTDPPTVIGIGYVHLTQADVGPYGGDFVAIGNAKGVGVDNCADDYDEGWTGYWDGRLGQIYFCFDFSPDQYGIGSNSTFQIDYGSCALAGGANRWKLTFGGSLRGCVNTGNSGAQGLYIGLETTGGSTVDRNIDVKYTNLKRNHTNGPDWVDLGNPGLQNLDPNYTYQWVSNTAQNMYLAPLD